MELCECVYYGQLFGIREYISLSVLVRSVKHNFMIVMYDVLWFIWQYEIIMLGILKSVSSYDKIYSTPSPSRRSLGKSLKINLGKSMCQ
jgi:hypothetical protein